MPPPTNYTKPYWYEDTVMVCKVCGRETRKRVYRKGQRPHKRIQGTWCYTETQGYCEKHKCQKTLSLSLQME